MERARSDAGFFYFRVVYIVISIIFEISKCKRYDVAMDTKQALSALASLAQEHRLAVFRLLVQTGPEGLAASKIGEQLALAPSSLSFHLKELSHAGLITARQQGRFLIYTADISAMNGLIGFLTQNCCGGNPC